MAVLTLDMCLFAGHHQQQGDAVRRENMGPMASEVAWTLWALIDQSATVGGALGSHSKINSAVLLASALNWLVPTWDCQACEMQVTCAQKNTSDFLRSCCILQ